MRVDLFERRGEVGRGGNVLGERGSRRLTAAGQADRIGVVEAGGRGSSNGRIGVKDGGEADPYRPLPPRCLRLRGLRTPWCFTRRPLAVGERSAFLRHLLPLRCFVLTFIGPTIVF